MLSTLQGVPVPSVFIRVHLRLKKFMQLIDKTYCGLPWKDGGRSRSGLDCAGLAQLWLTEQMGLNFTVPPTGPEPDAEKLFNPIYKAGALERGDVVFSVSANRAGSATWPLTWETIVTCIS